MRQGNIGDTEATERGQVIALLSDGGAVSKAYRCDSLWFT